MKAGTKVSTSGWIVSVASMVVTALLYYADVRNVPVLAPWLDWLADRIYSSLPILARTVPGARMIISPAAVGVAFFLVSTILGACFFPSSRIGPLENRMRDMQRQRRPRSVKVK